MSNNLTTIALIVMILPIIESYFIYKTSCSFLL